MNYSEYFRQRGIGLVEMMIAITLSLIIGAAVLQIFISQKNTYTTQDEMARLQEKARFVFDRIGKDIRMAGYWGCDHQVIPQNDSSSADYDDPASKAVRMISGNLTISYVDVNRPLPLNNSDTPTSVTGADNIALLKLADDCSHSDVFTGASWPLPMEKPVEVFPIEKITYITSGGALYRATFNSSLTTLDPDTIVIDDGVVGLTYAFGLGDGKYNYVASYKGATDYSAWGQDDAHWPLIGSVKVTLELSGNKVKNEKFSSVFTIRNRLP